MIPAVSSMAPLHLLGQDDQKEMWHCFVDYVMLIVPASATCDANCIINWTNAFVSQDKQNEEQHHFVGHVMHLVLTLQACDADGTVNGTPAFVGSR